MPQDEDSVFVDEKKEIAVGGNLLLNASSPPMINLNVAYSPVSKVVAIANTTFTEGFRKYSIGGGIYEKFSETENRYFRYDVIAFYSKSKVTCLKPSFSFTEGTLDDVFVNSQQFKFQNNIS
jgi:hypothetical protein